MSYYYDVILKVPRMEKELVEKVQEYAVENFGWEFKERGLYQRDLIGSFKTFFVSDFVMFLKSLDWKYDDPVELLWRGEDDYHFDMWGLNDVYTEKEWQEIKNRETRPLRWLEKSNWRPKSTKFETNLNCPNPNCPDTLTFDNHFDTFVCPKCGFHVSSELMADQGAYYKLNPQEFYEMFK